MDVAFFVAGGDANGYQRRVDWGSCRLDEDVEVILIVKPVNDDEPTDEKRGGQKKIDHASVVESCI